MSEKEDNFLDEIFTGDYPEYFKNIDESIKKKSVSFSPEVFQDLLGMLKDKPYEPKKIVCHPSELGMWLTHLDEGKYFTLKFKREDGTMEYETYEEIGE